MMSQRLRMFAAPLLLALAYFATGRLGLMLPAFGSSITLLWLPTGIAVAALMRCGFGCWPGVAIGAAAVNMSIGTALPTALAIAVGNTLGPLLAAWTLRRMGFHPAFDRKRDILLLAGAAVVGMLVSSSLGTVSLSLAGMLPDGRVAAWLIWWAGDTMGVVAAAPLVLAFNRKEMRVILLRPAEFALWLCVTALGTWAVFVVNRGSDGHALALSFVPLPLLAWAALRYGLVGISLAIIAISAGATYGTATGHGPFYRSQPIEGVAVLWLYMTTCATLGWLITALHAAQVQITGIQRLFERALSDVSLGVLIAEIDGRITFANEGFTRLTGYTEAELIGQGCSILQGPETDREAVDGMRAALRNDGHFDGEILNYRKDGTTFWDAVLISPVRDERGQTTGFLGILRDISQRKAAETALRESEEHLRAIIELEPECVKLVSREGTLLEMNPAGLAMIEADSIEQVRGAPAASIVAPEDRERFAVLHRRAANGETVRGEFAIKSLRGTHRWMETHEVPYRDARGEIIAVLGITRDITERKSVQEALASKVQELSAIYSNAPGIIFYLKVEGDEEFRFVSVNDAFLKATGFREEQVVGKLVREVIPPSSLAVVLAHYQEAIRTGKVVRWEETSEYPTGTKHGEVSVTPQFGADGVCTQLIGVVHDVTERKRAEQALRESEKRLCTLSEATFEGIAISENGVMLDCNEQLAEMCGRPRAELIGERIADFIAPEYRSNVAEAQRSGRTDPYENALLRADGTSCPVVTRARYLQVGGRQVRITAVQDNTERMEREQALRESEARYRRIVETAEEGIWMIDPQAKTSFANPKMAQMLGCTVEEMTGRDLYEFMDDEGRAISERNIARRKQGIAEQHDFKFRRKDGSAMWALLKTSPIRDADGTYAGALAMITDITARKNAEAALRKSEERYRELFDANPHPMWVYDLESLRFLAVNNAAIAHYGYSREELLTMTLKDIRPPEDIPALLASTRKAGGNFVEATVWRHRKRDGTLIDVEITAHGIEFAGHRAEVVLASDVTERRRSEVRLLQAEDAERRRIAKELHDSTAQDLVAVIMNLGAVQGLIPSGGTKAAHILEDSIALVENSVNEIRTLSYVLHPPQLDETGLAGALAEYAAGFTARTDRRIRVEVAPDLGRLPEDMEIVLFRVVQEGIANVLRHSGSDMATIRLGRTDENVVLEVEDYGRGMADAGARGVGIPGMKERLQYLGGRLEVKSGSGGTIIRAVLPLREIQK